VFLPCQKMTLPCFLPLLLSRPRNIFMVLILASVPTVSSRHLAQSGFERLRALTPSDAPCVLCALTSGLLAADLVPSLRRRCAAPPLVVHLYPAPERWTQTYTFFPSGSTPRQSAVTLVFFLLPSSFGACIWRVAMHSPSTQ